MGWALLVALLALPAAAADISDSTRAHLQSLEATAARLEREGNTGKQYEKVKGEIARIRREYRLDGSASQPKARTRPNWEDFTQAHNQAKAAAEARARADRDAEMKARAERAKAAAAKAAEEARAAQEQEKARADSKAAPEDPRWEKSKKEFSSLAEEELRRRQNYSRFYRTRIHWDYAYKAQMEFAQSPVIAGGLGYDFRTAHTWVKKVLEMQPPVEIAAFRKRYVKVLDYVRSPAEQGGPGYVRAFARQAALERALKSSEAEIDQWIAQSRQKVLSERGGFARFKDSCHAWFEAFGK